MRAPTGFLVAWNERMRALYRGTVLDLDRGFGELRAELEARGVLPGGWLLFTSDHGEAFLEHGYYGHGNGVWEEHVRIPLLIHGPGAAPARVAHAASLVDLPATIARIAGSAPHPAWLGRPLLELDRDRPAFAFGCRSDPGNSSLALVDGDRKLICPSTAAELGAGRIRQAFDLAADPAEQADVWPERPAWASELVERLCGTAVTLLEPAVGASEARIDEEKLRELNNLGYGSR